MMRRPRRFERDLRFDTLRGGKHLDKQRRPLLHRD